MKNQKKREIQSAARTGTLVVKDYRGISSATGSSATYTNMEIRKMVKRFLVKVV
jgi:hypothetical protein